MRTRRVLKETARGLQASQDMADKAAGIWQATGAAVARVQAYDALPIVIRRGEADTPRKRASAGKCSAGAFKRYE